MTHDDAVQARFSTTAARLAAHQAERADVLRERLRRFVPLSGEERALDSGTGTGALALALASLVREVVAADVVPELLEEARRAAKDYPNVTVLEGDATQLPFPDASFDLAASMRVLHHVRRPELVIAELARVTRPGGTLLVIDQLAPVDPLAAVELDRFERARDPSHTRLLPDIDLHHLFEANRLAVRRAEITRESRDLDRYLDLAGCTGDARDRARSLAPPGYAHDVGWYLVERPV